MGFASASSILTEVSGEPGDTSDITGRYVGDRILVPLLTPEVPALTDQLRVAAALSRASDATLHVVNPVTMSDRTPMTYGSELTPDQERRLLEWAIENAPSSTSQFEAGFLYTHQLLNGILATINRNDIDSLVVPGRSKTGAVRHGLTERLALRADCDVITVNGQTGYERAPSILLAVAGGPHSGLATDVANRIAVDCNAWIDVLHVVDGEATEHRRRRAEAFVEAAYRRIDRPDSTTTWVLEASDVAEAIIEQSAYYSLTVIGAPSKGRLRQFIAGSTNQTIREDAQSVVLSARKND